MNKRIIISTNHEHAGLILAFKTNLVYKQGKYDLCFPGSECQEIEFMLAVTDEEIEELIKKHQEEYNELLEGIMEECQEGLESGEYEFIKLPMPVNNGNAAVNRKGVVYTLRAGDEDLFKIGRTGANVHSRMKSIQTTCPYPLSIYHSFESDDCVSHERELHGHLSRYRCMGEWFRAPQSELDSVLVQYNGRVTK